MEIKLNPILLSIVFVSLLALVLLGFYSFTKENKKHTSETQALLDRLSDYKSTNANLKIKSTSLENLIEKTEEENILLLKQIADLKKQKQKIKYVDVIKYKTEETVVVKEVLPPNHIYRTKQGMAVCSFEHKDSFLFRVIPVEYTLNVVKSDKATSMSLTAKSDHEDEIYEIPIDINKSSSVTITKYPNINLNFSIGAALSYSNRLEVSPTLQVPFIHFNESLDVLTPKITINESPSIGLDLANYKVSNHIEILTDTWLGIGPSFSLDRKYFELTLTSKF